MMSRSKNNEYNLLNPSPSSWSILGDKNLLTQDVRVLGEGCSNLNLLANNLYFGITRN
jgi:hypothetical protein